MKPNMKFRIITALFTCFTCFTCATPVFAEQPDLLPVEEGWVNGASNATWSKTNPDILGVRNKGTENAWATYLMFDLPSDIEPLIGRNLVLQFATTEGREPESVGAYSLFGATEAHWFADSLNAQNAPAWDELVFDVGDDAVMLASEKIHNEWTEELTFPLEGDFIDFCREHAGRTVTLIITKHEALRSSAFHSNRGNPELGPRIR